jgi:hypothetical protein
MRVATFTDGECSAPHVVSPRKRHAGDEYIATPDAFIHSMRLRVLGYAHGRLTITASYAGMETATLRVVPRGSVQQLEAASGEIDTQPSALALNLAARTRRP